ncbi:MAG: O-antigen ligase family protein [Clostridia bacterium]|nr:O-antigen ligase family protein [Clostridia bacterium]
MALANSSEKLYLGKTAKEWLLAARAFFNSGWGFVLQTALAFIFVFLQQEVIGVIVFIGLLSVILIVCDDVIATTLPFLLVCTFSTNCYDSFDTFIGFAVYAPIPAAALVGHFLVYHKPYRELGESAYGLFAISCALILGGIGAFALKEYVFGAYYVFGLGIGMLVAYILMKSQFAGRRDYDLKEKFAQIMTCMGCLILAMFALSFIRRLAGDQIWGFPDIRWLIGANGRTGYTLGFSANNIATLLMFAMPFPLYLAKKRKAWAIMTVVFFLSLFYTESRGGMLFGAIEFLACFLYWAWENRTTKLCKVACVGAILVFIAVIALVIVKWNVVIALIQTKLLDGARAKMLFQAFDNFRENFVVGTGLLDDSIAYGETKKQGTMAWYHMMIPQIIGSMGLVGVFAYGYQIFGRVKLIFKKACAWSLVLGISYLGILGMSQVNPGEFCPVPYGVLTVLLFVFQELRLEENEELPLQWEGAFKKRK